MIEQCLGQENGRETFGGIEHQSRYTERRRFARYIRRANIAAAAHAYIFALKKFHQQVAKRDRSQQVPNRADDEIRRHVGRRLSKLTGGEPGVPSRPTGETPVSPFASRRAVNSATSCTSILPGKACFDIE